MFYLPAFPKQQEHPHRKRGKCKGWSVAVHKGGKKHGLEAEEEQNRRQLLRTLTFKKYPVYFNKCKESKRVIKHIHKLHRQRGKALRSAGQYEIEKSEKQLLIQREAKLIRKEAKILMIVGIIAFCRLRSKKSDYIRIL